MWLPSIRPTDVQLEVPLLVWYAAIWLPHDGDPALDLSSPACRTPTRRRTVQKRRHAPFPFQQVVHDPQGWVFFSI